MGQKVNPHGLRVGIIKDWDSRWYAEDHMFGDNLVEDYKIREYLKNKLYSAGVAKLEIEKKANTIKVSIHTAKPGIIIGRKGEDIEKLKAEVSKLTDKQVFINIVEIKQADLSAQLVAESIAAQLERRISFRRAMKGAMSRAMKMVQRVSRQHVAAVSAVLKSQEASTTMKVQFRCRHFVLT